MLVLNSKITIGNFTFDFVSDTEFSASVDELTSGGEIILPKNVVFKKDNQILENIVGGSEALFKRGDAVKIELGYSPNLSTYFTGFVTQIAPGFPLLFDVEDEMYIYKQTRVAPLNLTKTTLSNLLTQILPEGTDFIALDVNLGNFRIAKPTTVAKVLDYKIKEQYGLSAYINNDGVLYVGLAYPPEEISKDNATIFKFGANIINDNNLIYQREEDQLIKLTAVSILPDNTKIEIDLGDEDGEQRTLFKYNVSESGLRTFAEEQIDKLKYTGFKGSFEAFIEPQVKRGEVIQIIHEAFPEKDGFYLVRSVRYRFGQSGGRQYIELEKKIGDKRK